MKKNKLKVSILCFLLGVIFLPVCAQEKAALYGTWALDSVRVKETTPEGVIEKMIIPGERSKYDDIWMKHFTIEGDVVSYTDFYENAYTDNSYELQSDGKNKILMIYGVPDVKTYILEIISNNRLVFLYSFSGSYDMKPVDISWRLYYSKN